MNANDCHCLLDTSASIIVIALIKPIHYTVHVVQKIWTSCVFKFPENLGVWCLHLGVLVFAHGPENLEMMFSNFQKIWVLLFTGGPENLDQLYFQVPRKAGCVVFTRCPENPDLLYLQVPRKSGGVVFTVYTWSRKSGPDVFSHSQKIWVSGILT
jgi:hypothetical protein